MSEPEVGATYRHFKGGTYRVVATATKEDTGETLVVYRGASNPDSSVWARSLEGWNELILLQDEGVGSHAVPRFRKVEER